MSIRMLNESDLPRMTEIAQRGLEFDEVNEPLVREKTLGARDCVPEFNLGFEVQGRLVGFVSGCLGRRVDDKQRSHVRLMVVDRAYRQAGIGSALLREIESRLKGQGAHEISIFDSPNNYFMPGVDFRYTEAYCFLQKHKYEMYRENHNLICDLDAKAWPTLDEDAAALGPQGFELRRARPDDAELIHAFLESNWPAWHDEVQGALDNDPPTLYVAFHEGRCVAFSGYQGNNKSLSWFGPMGTDPVCRGKGIGGILLRWCLRDLALQGWRQAIIPWVGPVRFYAHYCGARLDRCFWAWRKNL